MKWILDHKLLVIIIIVILIIVIPWRKVFGITLMQENEATPLTPQEVAQNTAYQSQTVLKATINSIQDLYNPANSLNPDINPQQNSGSGQDATSINTPIFSPGAPPRNW